MSLFLPDILEDMKEECQKYGSVVSLLIPKENPGKGQVRFLFLKPGIFKNVSSKLKKLGVSGSSQCKK